jgi:hypothetical protein
MEVAMNRVLLAAVFATAAVGMARADLLPPGRKNIPVNHTVETDKEHPAWAFFTLGGNGAVKPVKLDPKTPLVIPGSGAVGRGPVPRPGETRKRPYRSTALAAVPKDAAKAYPGEKEFHAALDAEKVPGMVLSPPLWDHESVKDTDPRKSVSQRHKLEKLDPKGLTLTAVKEPKPAGSEEEEEQAAAPPVRPWGVWAAGTAASLGVALGGLWLVRRRQKP